jgi:hypothetical protein
LASMYMSLLPASFPHGATGLALIYLNGVLQVFTLLPNHRERIAVSAWARIKRARVRQICGPPRTR